MEICKIEISKDLLQLLVDSNAITTNDFKLIAVNENDIQLQNNPVWKSAKEKADKAYKEFKKIEFNLIHKIDGQRNF